jgi:hypothetical protein
MLAKRIFLVTFCLSLCAKIFFLVFQYNLMRAPRMGDDALTYQWKSHVLFNQTEFYNSKLYLNLKELSARSSNENDWIENRFAMRAVGIFSIPHSILTQVFLAAGTSLQLNFFLTELFIALLFSIAIARFSLVFLNYYEASVAVFLTVFTFDRFVPTNLALGLSIWCWMVCLKDTAKGAALRRGMIFLTSLLASLVHPVGKAFVFICSPTLLSSKKLIDLGFLIGGVLVAILIECSLPQDIDFIVRGTARLNISISTLTWNLSGIYKLFVHEILYFVTIASAIGLLSFRLIKTKRLDQLEILIFGLFSFLLATLFHELPGYELEAFSRIIPPLYIVSVIYLIKLKLNIIFELPKKILAVALISLSMVVWIPGFIRVYQLSLKNIYGRPYFFDEKELPQLLAALRSDPKPIIFAETDFSLFYTMIFNGSDLDIFPSNYLQSQQSFTIFDNRPEMYVCGPYPRWLNPTSILKDKRIGKVFHGFFLDRKSELRLSGVAPKMLELQITSDGNAGEFDVIYKQGNCGYTKKYKVVKKGTFQFDSLPECKNEKSVLTIKTPVVLKIVAAKTNPTSETVWPWDSGIQVHYMRGGSSFEEQFSFDDYIRKHHLPSLPENYQLTSVLPDQSGLICGKYLIK